MATAAAAARTAATQTNGLAPAVPTRRRAVARRARRDRLARQDHRLLRDARSVSDVDRMAAEAERREELLAALPPARMFRDIRACVQADVVFGAIDAFRELSSGEVEPDSKSYRALVRSANDVFGRAFESLRRDYGLRSVFLSSPVDGADNNGALDITDLAIEAIHKVQQAQRAT